MTILLTGVTGFVGTNLVTYFNVDPTVKIYGLTRRVDDAYAKFKSTSLEIIDHCDAEKLNDLCIDVIIHLAGIAHDLSNQFVEADYYKVNYENTVEIYTEFLKSNAKTFIYFSSIKAAVDTVTEPVDETIAANPITPYGKSKLKAEEFISSNNKQSKNYYILRPCMIHGPGNKGNLNLLYKFVKTGIPYPLGAFQNKRSFLNSDNLNFIIDQLIRTRIESGIYNLSDEGSLSTNEVVTGIALALGKKPRIWNVPLRFVTLIFVAFGKRKMLGKLTESMEVSNHKLLSAIKKHLPVTIEEGLKRTIRSFHE